MIGYTLEIHMHMNPTARISSLEQQQQKYLSYSEV